MVLQSKGYAAWITVGGVELEQYGVETDISGDKLTCWIPSEIGKAFTIHVRDTYRMFPIGAGFKLDGVPIGGSLLPADPFGQPIAFSRSSVPTSRISEKPFMFSQLQLTDDEMYLDAQGSAQNLGEIYIEIWHAIPCGPGQHLSIDLNANEKVHERSKKALAHRIKLGEHQYCAQPPVMRIQKQGEKPLVTFMFKYRSLDMLRANGIAPMASASSATHHNKPQSDIKPAVKREAAEIPEHDTAKEILSLERRLATLKRQQSSTSGNTNKRVKHEPREQLARRPFVQGEVIDLT